MAAEKKEEQFNLRISRELLDEGQAKAKKLDISFAWIVRKLIKMWVDGQIEIK